MSNTTKLKAKLYYSATMLIDSNIPCDTCKNTKERILDYKYAAQYPWANADKRIGYFCLECFEKEQDKEIYWYRD